MRLEPLPSAFTYLSLFQALTVSWKLTRYGYFLMPLSDTATGGKRRSHLF